MTKKQKIKTTFKHFTASLAIFLAFFVFMGPVIATGTGVDTALNGLTESGTKMHGGVPEDTGVITDIPTAIGKIVGAILAFVGLHFYDFWFPEINTKFIIGDMSGLNEAGELRYFEELQHKFVDAWRVVLYIIAFIFLALHLLHGFNSAFQSVGANNKYTKGLKGFSKVYAIGIPLGFIFIALFHYFNHAH